LQASLLGYVEFSARFLPTVRKCPADTMKIALKSGDFAKIDTQLHRLVNWREFVNELLIHYFQCVKERRCIFIKYGGKNPFLAKILPPGRGYKQPYRDGHGPRERRLKRTARSLNQFSDPLEGQNMMNFIKNFSADESGAVTVDWVVLTAAVVALAGAAYTSIKTGATTLTGTTSTYIQGKTPTD
jgi:Flp pilus assembly pilin Flp